MAEGGGSASLLLEAKAAVGVASGVLWQGFERYLAAQARVLSQIDHSHAAVSQLFQDAVVRKVLAYKGRRGGHWAAMLGRSPGQVNGSRARFSARCTRRASVSGAIPAAPRGRR